MASDDLWSMHVSYLTDVGEHLHLSRVDQHRREETPQQLVQEPPRQSEQIININMSYWYNTSVVK